MSEPSLTHDSGLFFRVSPALLLRALMALAALAGGYGAVAVARAQLEEVRGDVAALKADKPANAKWMQSVDDRLDYLKQGIDEIRGKR